MRIAFALFADAANLSQEGKLNVLGVFDAVQVGQLPTIHPRAHLVARITGTRADIGTHAMTLTWRSPSGETIWSSNGELGIEQPPAGVEQMDLPFIAALDLPLDRAGTFTLAIEIGGAQMPQSRCRSARQRRPRGRGSPAARSSARTASRRAPAGAPNERPAGSAARR